MKKNNTETSTGWKIFSIAWPPGIYKKICSVSKKTKVTKGELIRNIVIKSLKNGKN